MISCLLIGFTSLFFILGHSTLLYFREKDSERIPIADVIFPWPKNGKFVSILCLALSFASFVLMLTLDLDLNNEKKFVHWKIITILVFFPIGFYLNYLYKRINKNSEGSLCFICSVGQEEWRFPWIFSVSISFIFLVFY